MVKYLLTVNIHSADDLLGTLIVSQILGFVKSTVSLWFKLFQRCWFKFLVFLVLLHAKYILLRKLGKHGIFSIFTYSINITQGRLKWFINVKLMWNWIPVNKHICDPLAKLFVNFEQPFFSFSAHPVRMSCRYFPKQHIATSFLFSLIWHTETKASTDFSSAKMLPDNSSGWAILD